MHGLVGISTKSGAALLVVALLGCGGDGGTTTEEQLDEWSGEYLYYVIYEEWNDIEVEWLDFVADGKGRVEAGQAGAFNYTIAADRTLLIIPDPQYETVPGRISADGSIVLVGDPVYDIPGDNDKDVELAIAVRKSSGHSMAALAGTYHICQAGRNGNGYYTARVEVVMNADGSGTWEILAHSQGNAGNGAVTVTVDPSDGTLTVNNGLGTDPGIVSPDGNLFVIADGDDADADGEVMLGVGVRHDTGPGSPDITGMLMLYQLAQSDNMSAWKCYGSRVRLDCDGAEFTYDVEAHSEGHTGSGGPSPYSLMGDGWLMFPGSAMQGHVSRDGNFMAIVSTDMKAEEEILLALALK